MSAHESMLALQWFNTVLTGDSTLMSLVPGNIYRAMAPPNTVTPFIIIALQASTDVITMNGFRLITSLLYQVKAVGPSGVTATLAQAAARIDDLLGLTSGVVTGGAILSCIRDSPLQTDEIVNGELWTNIGGLYRIQIEKTN
jgi:hypothetical protein